MVKLNFSAFGRSLTRHKYLWTILAFLILIGFVDPIVFGIAIACMSATKRCAKIFGAMNSNTPPMRARFTNCILIRRR